MLKQLMLVLALCSTVPAQTGSEARPPSQDVALQATPAASGDSAERMRAELNQLEGMLNNMATEVGLIRDPNLQMLLTTNVQMWSTLIHNMRLQLNEMEGRRGTSPSASPPKK